MAVKWAEVIDEFADQIADYVGPDLAAHASRRFSSTTRLGSTVFQTGLMDAMKSYFAYELETLCGIPQIRLEGSADDWHDLRERTEYLRRYDLEWWCDQMIAGIRRHGRRVTRAR